MVVSSLFLKNTNLSSGLHTPRIRPFTDVIFYALNIFKSFFLKVSGLPRYYLRKQEGKGMRGEGFIGRWVLVIRFKFWPFLKS